MNARKGLFSFVIVAALVAALSGLAPPAQAGLVQYIPITSDADCDISSAKTYTHALDCGTWNLATVNGVPFTRITKSTGSFPANFDYQPSEANRDDHPGNDSHNVAPGSGVADLMQDMIYDGNNPAGGKAKVTLSGLIPGVRYDARVYTRQWGASNRTSVIGFDTTNDGLAEDAITINEDNARAAPPGFAAANQAYALSYKYTAATDRLGIEFEQERQNYAWHLYGVTNEFVDPTVGMEVKITGDGSYAIYVSGDPNQAGALIGSADGWETPEVYNLDIPLDQTLYMHIVGTNGFTGGGDWAGVIAQFLCDNPDAAFLSAGPTTKLLTTSALWEGNATGFGDPTEPVTVIGLYGGAPWGTRPGVGAFDPSAAWIWYGAPLIGQGQTYSPVYLTYAFKVTVPEPATLALLGVAAAALGGYVRSRRAKSRGRRRA